MLEAGQRRGSTGCLYICGYYFFFFSSRRRHTRFDCDWSSDVCSSDLRWPGQDTLLLLFPTPISFLPIAKETQSTLKRLSILRRPYDSKKPTTGETTSRAGCPRRRTLSIPEQIGRASCRERVESVEGGV